MNGCSDSGGGSDADAAATDASSTDGSPSAIGEDGGGSNASPTDAGAADATKAVDGSGGDGGIPGFLLACTMVGNPGDCTGGLQCKLFKGKGTMLCTKPCTDDKDCPSPAKGCGGDSFCSPP